MKKLFLMIIFLLFFANTGWATTYYVDKDCVHGCNPCSDSNSGTSWATAFCTIQKAASIVNPGDTVIVADGTYYDHNSDGFIVNLTRGGSSDSWITFKSENKWGAVLDGQNNTASFGWLFNTNAAYIRVEDFEIKGCKWGGFWANSGSSNHDIYMFRNHIHNIGNYYCENPDYGRCGAFIGANVYNITFDSNIWHHNGRIECNGQPNAHDHHIYACGKNITIINNIFYDWPSGWAIQDGNYGNEDGWKIVNNTFYGNTSPITKGALRFWNSYSTNHDWYIENNIFHDVDTYTVYNSAVGNYTNFNFRNNLLYNVVIEHPSYPFCNQRGYTCSDNINGDPKFVRVTDENFHLQSASPAIDKGKVFPLRTKDADGNSIVGAPDIGAYEYAGTPAPADTTPPAPPSLIKVQ
jgi:hypothetical protein